MVAMWSLLYWNLESKVNKMESLILYFFLPEKSYDRFKLETQD